MSALSLVADYSSDSEDDANRPIPTKLPLPALIQKKNNDIDYIDDPEKHAGRVRSFPHERGNWSTFVYIPFVPNKQFHSLVGKLLQRSCDVGEFKIVEDFHISLSKTVVLRFHWITNFVSSLKEIFHSIESFDVFFETLAVYCNEEKTRTFLGLKIDENSLETIEPIIDRIDKLLSEFKLENFYKDPSLHISLLWCVGDKYDELNNIINELRGIVDDYLFADTEISEDSCSNFSVKKLCCKSGNKVFSFYLNKYS